MVTLYEQHTEGATHHALDFEAIDESTAQGLVFVLVRLLKLVMGARTPIAVLAFSVRAENVLKRSHILTLQELSDWSRTFPGAGTKTFLEFKRALDGHALPYPRIMTEHLHTHNFGI
jgi:hypothetical protein